MPTTSAQLPLMKRNMATAPEVPEPFSIQLESYRTALLQQAYLIIGNHADAEDAVQETLISAMREHARLTQTGLGAWLRSVNRANAVDCLRGKRTDSRCIQKKKQQASENTFTTGGFSQLELHDSLSRAIHTLPANLQEAVNLRFFEHLSYKQIAERLRIPIGNVSALLMDASAALYARMRDQINTAPPLREGETQANPPVE